MKKLILTSVVALFVCFTAFGQNAGKCQPKCGGNEQSASVYNLTDFSAKSGTAESRNCGTAVVKKCGVAEAPSCGVAKTTQVNASPGKSCTSNVVESSKCGTVKSKGKSIAKL